jgi:hypothetical protein
MQNGPQRSHWHILAELAGHGDDQHLSRMPELISQHGAHFHAWIHYPAASPSALGKNDPFLLT